MVVRDMLGTALNACLVHCCGVCGRSWFCRSVDRDGVPDDIRALVGWHTPFSLLARGVGGFSRGHALPFFPRRDRAGM